MSDLLTDTRYNGEAAGVTASLLTRQADPAARTRSVLVIDDERAHRLILGRAAEAMGMQVSVAAGLEAASMRLEAGPVDVVTLDLSLGDHDRVRLLRELATCRPLPVVILVSGMDDRVRAATRRLAEAYGLPVAGTLRKPIIPSQVQAMLRMIPSASPLREGPQLAKLEPSDLADGLLNGEITPVFQPKVNMRTMEVIGVEALARWNSPKFGQVTPDQFIPIAERHGLIAKLTLSVLEDSLRARAQWQSLSSCCTVAVNISPLVLVDPDLPEKIEALLAAHHVPPMALIAEVTESTMFANPMLATEVLTRLRIKGIGLSIDDFGTGHSSLLSLLNMPFSELKIDRSFVAASVADPDARKIVRATVSLGRELGLRIVGEGVETQDVADVLLEAGCDIGQGWLFGRGMSHDLLMSLLGANALGATALGAPALGATAHGANTVRSRVPEYG